MMWLTSKCYLQLRRFDRWFGLWQGGKMYMFFELKNSITKQGDIGVAESSDNGATWRHVGIALDEEWHLSYPFVFEYDGEVSFSSYQVLTLQKLCVMLFPSSVWSGPFSPCDMSFLLQFRSPLMVPFILQGPMVVLFACSSTEQCENLTSELHVQIYMMPEGSKKGDLRLYKALDFPLEWKLEKVLIHKPLVDASIVEYKGQYWIFASDFSRFGAQKNGELEIWFAPTPLGPWHQHRGNPVVNGNKSLGARSGGRPFVWEGKLYRFGQDCGDSYGRRLRAFHVITLTKDEFWEVEIPLGIEESKKGRNAWNGLRYHHMDVQQLPSGNWIAVMDGDRVPSSDLLIKYTIGSAALLVLLALNILVGVLFGCVRFVFPAGCILPSKRSDTLLPHIHLQLIPRIYKTLNRSSPILRGRMWLRLCMGFLLLLFVFILCVCAVSMVVKCFFGGNGAEEPYPYKGQFSQFTMIAMTHEARLWNLKMYIKHYSRCASVREIVVVWNIGQPPDPVTEFDSAVPVRIRVEPENSLNNRFKPDPLIKTRAVFELDDDIMMTCDDVERGFKAWRENSDRLVGFYPRLIDGNPLKYRDERYARHRKGYNMILTGAAFINSELTFSRYWSKEMDTGRALVDELFNCEDILMNFILANSTTSGHTVEYVHPAWAVDTSKLSSSAISRNTRGHYSKRTHCLLRFSQLYGGIPLKKWEFNSRNDGWDSW